MLDGSLRFLTAMHARAKTASDRKAAERFSRIEKAQPVNP
jgi:hypothetical protein